MKLIDTHCHIHDTSFFAPEEAEVVFTRSAQELEAMLLIGTSIADSKQALLFSERHAENTKVAIGVHPHEAAKLSKSELSNVHTDLMGMVTHPQIRAIGECGLDFYYNDREKQLKNQTILLEQHLQIALEHNLPVSFHVREAFDDFWPIFNNFLGLTGVLHSFTDNRENAEKACKLGLFIGVNGIATFTKHEWQRDVFAWIPLENLLLETDAPFLTPSPIRGTMNEPRNVTYVTNFLAELRGENAEVIAKATTINARRLFGF